MQTANEEEEEEKGETFDVIITKIKTESDGDQEDREEETGKNVITTVIFVSLSTYSSPPKSKFTVSTRGSRIDAREWIDNRVSSIKNRGSRIKDLEPRIEDRDVRRSFRGYRCACSGKRFSA